MKQLDLRNETVLISEIDLGKRARKDYKDVPTLARKIDERGLLNPITLWKRGDHDYLLLAGGRRLRAHQFLKREEIEARISDRQLDPLEIKCVELEENIHREELDYIEKIKLEQEIHQLQIDLYGEKVSTSPDAEGASLSTTAELLKVDKSSLSRDMKIAKAMEQFPEVQWNKCKNKSEAFKLVKKLHSSIGVMEAAKAAVKEMGVGDAAKTKMINAYVVGDFFKKVEETPDNYFDIVEIDPPYAIDLTKVKKGYNYEGYNEVEFAKYEEFIDKTLKACYRKMSTNAWLLLWFGPDPWYYILQQLLRKNHFETTGLVGIWAKGAEDELGVVRANAGQSHKPTTRLANAYEMFFYAWKGNPTLAKAGRSNVFGFSPTPAGQKYHPTERPISVRDELFSTFAIPGQNLLVPFAGSGVSLLSAFKNGLKPIGFDLTQGFKDGYTLRVQQESFECSVE